MQQISRLLYHGLHMAPPILSTYCPVLLYNPGMLKIGDFSQLGQVSVRTLRHYDEMGLLKPTHIDRFTDYRYYSVEQLSRLNRILALKDLGLSLEQIAHVLNESPTADQLRSIFAAKQTEIEQQLLENRAKLERVSARLRHIEQEGKLPDYEVTLKQAEPVTIAASRRVVPTIADMAAIRCRLFTDVYAWLDGERIHPSGPELAVYHSRSYTEQDIDLEAGVVVPDGADTGRGGPTQVTTRQLSNVKEMASVLFQGNFYDVGQSMVALFTWMGENNYSSCGPYREIHLFGRENDLPDVESVVVEMQIPVEKNKPHNMA